MLARGTDILDQAVTHRTAVPAFATYNLEMVHAVVAAAEQTGEPVIMLAASSHSQHAGRTALITIALQAARDSTAIIGVHLALVLHGASGLPDEQISAAVRCGVAKVDINTELRQAYLAVAPSALPALLSTHDSVALWRAPAGNTPRRKVPAMPENNLRVAVIGLGAMGLPMATHLATTFPVTGFDPFKPRRELAAQSSITAEATPGAACPDADIALLAVRDHAQAETALFGPEGVLSTLKPGAPVILTSTVGPDAARELAGKLEAAGYPLIDAPISGGPVRAGNGDLLIVVGATDAGLAAAQPVLDALSSTLTIVGPRPGDGQALKAINQLLAGVHIAAAAEAIALTRGLGLDPAVVIDALSRGAAGSFMFADRGPRMLQAYTGGAEVKSRIDIFVKDMGIVTSVGRTSHVPLPLAAAAQQLYLIAEAAGLGAQDDSSVVTVLSPPNTEKVAAP